MLSINAHRVSLKNQTLFILFFLIKSPLNFQVSLSQYSGIFCLFVSESCCNIKFLIFLSFNLPIK